jgi:hypothetical protein
MIDGRVRCRSVVRKALEISRLTTGTVVSTFLTTVESGVRPEMTIRTEITRVQSAPQMPLHAWEAGCPLDYC